MTHLTINEVLEQLPVDSILQKDDDGGWVYYREADEADNPFAGVFQLIGESKQDFFNRILTK